MSDQPTFRRGPRRLAPQPLFERVLFDHDPFVRQVPIELVLERIRLESEHAILMAREAGLWKQT